MAQYHLTMKNISRSDGRNAVKSAAYRHGQVFFCERTGEVFGYSDKSDVEHCEISVPETAPIWAKRLASINAHQASSQLWNAVEFIEKRKDARLAKEVEFSLPHELTQDQRLKLTREFIRETFTSKGMIADWAVHNHFDKKDGIEKPHVHVILVTRKLVDSLVIKSQKQMILSYGSVHLGKKNLELDAKAFLQTLRQSWEICANKHLERAGLTVRIDHRSYKDRGIAFEPQPKMGKGPREMERRGYTLNRCEDRDKVKERNRLLIHNNPDIVLDALTRQHSIFTKRDIVRVLKRSVDDPNDFQRLLEYLESSPQLVKVSDDRRGAEQKLTTQAMIDLEVSLMRKAETLKDQRGAVVSLGHQSSFVHATNERMKREHGGSLSSDQMHAIYHMTGVGQVKVVVGYAGAGKSTCLETAKAIWEKAGYRVVGAAPMGKAADNLEGSGIASKTLHKWAYEWERNRELLGTKDILVVDEAGMVDSRRLDGLLEESQKRGFKVVLVGDPEQLSPIEAGCGIRTVMDKTGFVEINTIQRQQETWQREATKLLATQQTQTALEIYDQRGCVHVVDQAKEALMAAYGVEMKRKRREDPLECVILSYTNRDVKDLNQRARALAREYGRLQGPDHVLTVIQYKNTESLDPKETVMPKEVKEEKSFAVGDQIVFLRNDYGIGVKNGQFGVIQKIEEGMIEVEDSHCRSFKFDVSLYRSFDHGYATTIHKSQGDTIDKTFVYASKGMDRHLTYVALSRHRQEGHVYGDKKTFKSKESMFKTLSRDNPKENVFDYGLEQGIDKGIDQKREKGTEQRVDRDQTIDKGMDQGTDRDRAYPSSSSKPLPSVSEKGLEKSLVTPDQDWVKTFLQLREKIESFPYVLERTTEQKEEHRALCEFSREVSFTISQDPELMKKIKALGFEQNVITQSRNYVHRKQSSQNISYDRGRGMSL